MARTFPNHVHPNAVCKHMVAIEHATDDVTLETFPFEDNDNTEPEDCDSDDHGTDKVGVFTA